MVSITYLVALLSSSFTFVRSAPVAALDADTLSQNGIDAQRLNAIFQSIRATDTCNTGDIACVGGATAKCVDGVWQLTECPATQSCLVLPSIREKASLITCTSERSALSIIESTGATGGITGEPISGPPSETLNPAPNPASESTSTRAGNTNGGGPLTITVTIPIPAPATTITLPPVTITIPLDDPTIIATDSQIDTFTTLGPPGTTTSGPVLPSSSSATLVPPVPVTTLPVPPAPLPSTTNSLEVIVRPQTSGAPVTLRVPTPASPTQPISSQPPTTTIRLTAARPLQTDAVDSPTAIQAAH